MAEKKKILYLVTLSEMAGAQNYLADLAGVFKNHPNYEVEAAAGGKKEGQLIKMLVKMGVKTYYLRHLQRKINFYNDLNAFFSLIRLFRKSRPDIAHLNSSKSAVLGALAARLAGVKNIVTTVHGSVMNERLSPLKRSIYWLAEKYTGWLTDVFICVSEKDKKTLLEKRLASAGKIQVIHNGINDSQINYLVRDQARGRLSEIIKEKIDGRGLWIGTVANLYPNKGLAYLVEAARIARQYENNLRFIVIGEGPERKKMEKAITEAGLAENFFLAGEIEQCRSWLKAFDLFILPSLKEGLPYALIEASAAGLAIIASEVGGIPEIITPELNGLMVQPGNPTALAEKIIYLANNQEKRNFLGEKAKENAKRFSLEKMSAKTGQIYDYLIKNKA